MKKRYTTVAGRTLIIRESASTCAGRGKRRRARENRTPEAVAKVNRINRERDLTAKLNHNFVPGDLWVTLTYENETEGYPSREECMKKFRNFRKCVQRWGKKHGVNIKAIDSFGIGSRLGRPHHHMVISDIPTDVMLKYWTYGGVHIEVLHGYNYQRIAKYMLKNARQSEDGKITRAYNCTRTIVTPETKVEIMASREITRDPEDIRTVKGYHVDRDTVNTYEHPIFEVECIEYIMVSDAPEPRLTRWSRGRTVRNERQYATEWPEQLGMFVEESR